LSARLKEDHKAGWRLTVRICYYDFRNVTRSRRASRPIWRADDLFLLAMEIFEENYDEEEAVRLLGISVDDFADSAVLMSQMNLFEEPDSREEVAVVLKELNHQLGSKGFMRASDLLKKE
ncbi:MAG: DNA polymerase IV, partial [Solobacterium sp.]|nr:DNA polymerase IV [Solobacterium sp.]